MRKWIVLLMVAVLVLASAVPAFAATKSKPVFVQHPYTAKQRYKVGAEFATWGYVTPKASDLTSKTIEIRVFQRTGPRTWVLVKSVDAPLYNRPAVRHKTLYRTTLSLDATGQYRMRAVYAWKDALGVMHSKLSSYKYFRIVK